MHAYICVPPSYIQCIIGVEEHEMNMVISLIHGYKHFDVGNIDNYSIGSPYIYKQKSWAL